jgi:pimeloyl-ACP methyl ester carboxylesterase
MKSSTVMVIIITGITLLFNINTLHSQNNELKKATVPQLVIVHGAWGGSWAFKEVDERISKQGYTVVRPSLTGLGERVHLASADINLSTHINDVVNAILFENLNDVVLVGHSYGGMVITGVADRIPDRISHIVYLDAFLPKNGESLVKLTGDDSWIQQMTKGEFVIPVWVKPDQEPPKDVPHPLKTLTEPLELTSRAQLKIPGSYILTVAKGTKASDDDFAENAQRAEELGYTNYTLISDHNPQWSAPEELADLLVKILRITANSYGN